MKVFLSWSGDVSKQMAVILKDWLPNVLQFVDPYISSDIDKGARWGIDIAQELEASLYGILCVTLENLEASWLMFEAGALSKSLDNSRVSPLLFGLKPSQLKGPILHFQATTAVEKEDVLKLVKSMNTAAADSVQLDDGRLNTVFTKWWPDLKASFAKLEPADAKAVEDSVDPNSAILEELLSLAREQHRLIKGPVLDSISDRNHFSLIFAVSGPTDAIWEFVKRLRTVGELDLDDEDEDRESNKPTLELHCRLKTKGLPNVRKFVISAAEGFGLKITYPQGSSPPQHPLMFT